VTLHVLCGLPGSGKTTLADSWVAAHLVDAHVSSDRLRARLTGDERDLSRDEEVWRHFHRTISRVVGAGGSVVADATHLSAEARARTLEDGAAPRLSFDGSSYLHLVDPGLWPTLERNRSRERPVPEEAMQRMVGEWARLVTGSSEDLLAEGFRDLVLHPGGRNAGISYHQERDRFEVLKRRFT
jgi:predicted kinase